MYILTQDNNRGLPNQSVQISKEDLLRELKSHFRWRKGDFIHRMHNELGSIRYDEFIAKLIRRGYKQP